MVHYYDRINLINTRWYDNDNNNNDDDDANY